MHRANALFGAQSSKPKASESKESKTAISKAEKSAAAPHYRARVYGDKATYYVLVIDSEFNPDTKFYEKRYHLYLDENERKRYDQIEGGADSEKQLIKFFGSLVKGKHHDLVELIRHDKYFKSKCAELNVMVDRCLTPAERAKQVQDVAKSDPSPSAYIETLSRYLPDSLQRHNSGLFASPSPAESLSLSVDDTTDENDEAPPSPHTPVEKTNIEEGSPSAKRQRTERKVAKTAEPKSNWPNSKLSVFSASAAGGSSSALSNRSKRKR